MLSKLFQQNPQQVVSAAAGQGLPLQVASEATVATLASNAAVPAVPEKKRRRGRSGSFPQKIHQMLRDLEEQGRQDIASFVRDGAAFCIHRPKEFSKEVMPKYFKMGSYASFQRQVRSLRELLLTILFALLTPISLRFS